MAKICNWLKKLRFLLSITHCTLPSSRVLLLKKQELEERVYKEIILLSLTIETRIIDACVRISRISIGDLLSTFLKDRPTADFHSGNRSLKFEQSLFSTSD
jgi:hypothetical protein